MKKFKEWIVMLLNELRYRRKQRRDKKEDPYIYR